MAAFLDRVLFRASANGTGTWTVSPALTGYMTPASAGAVNATVYSYAAESDDKTEWEIGTGTYTVSGTTLSRTPSKSSNANAAVNFTAAPKVAVTALTADIQPSDADLTSWASITRASGFDTFATTPSSANLRALLSDEVGTGAAYFVGGALGTPASATLTNATGLPVASGISGLGTGVATFLATPSSANLAAAVTDEVGSTALAFQSKGNTTPTVTATTGTFTTVSCALSWVRTGDEVAWTAAITITTNGTAAGSLVVPLPFTNSANAAPVYGIDSNNALALTGAITASTATASVFKYDGTYPGANGKVLVVGGTYRV